MIWIIERYLNGQWDRLRRSDQLPIMYTTRAQAQIALRHINDTVPGRYRIVGVTD